MHGELFLYKFQTFHLKYLYALLKSTTFVVLLLDICSTTVGTVISANTVSPSGTKETLLGKREAPPNKPLFSPPPRPRRLLEGERRRLVTRITDTLLL